MEPVTIADARENLEDLIARAARGEDVRIDVPAVGTVRLQVIAKARNRRVFGRLAGKIKSPAGMLDPMTAEEFAEWPGK